MITDRHGKPLFSEQKQNSPIENWEGLKKILHDNIRVGQQDLEKFKLIQDNQERCHKINVGKQGLSIMTKVLDLMQRLETGQIKVNITGEKPSATKSNIRSTPSKLQG